MNSYFLDQQHFYPDQPSSLNHLIQCLMKLVLNLNSLLQNLLDLELMIFFKLLDEFLPLNSPLNDNFELLEVLLDESPTFELFLLFPLLETLDCLSLESFLLLFALLEVLDCLSLEALLDELSMLELFWLLLDDFNWLFALLEVLDCLLLEALP